MIQRNSFPRETLENDELSSGYESIRSSITIRLLVFVVTFQSIHTIGFYRIYIAIIKRNSKNFAHAFEFETVKFEV